MYIHISAVENIYITWSRRANKGAKNSPTRNLKKKNKNKRASLLLSWNMNDDDDFLLYGENQRWENVVYVVVTIRCVVVGALRPGELFARDLKKNNNQATEMRSRPPYTRRTTWLGETRGRAADANVDATLTRTYQLFVVYTHTHTSTHLYVCVCVCMRFKNMGKNA